MAIWQYTIEIVPKAALIELGATDSITNYVYDNYDLWNNYAQGVEFFESLTVDFERSKSWSDEIIVFGDNESTCINFYMEEDQIVGVVIRIDFRREYSIILNSVIEFCYLNGFVIIDDLKILNLNAESIVHHIENSDQLATYKRLFGGSI